MTTVEQGGWIGSRYYCLINDEEWSATADDVAKARRLVAKSDTSCVKVGYPSLWLDESDITTVISHMADAPNIDFCQYDDRPGFHVIEGDPYCRGHAAAHDEQAGVA